jgi:threonine dehydratase
MVTLADIRAAQDRLRGIATRTPLIEFKLCDADPRRLFLKPENQQPIGAFKLRGAYNKIASLPAEDLKRQPCPGRGLCRPSSWSESRNRDA